MRTKLVTVIGAVTLGGALAVASEDSATVPYPKGYRDWTHVKAMILEAGHPLYESFGGIHHFYANDKAMQGYRKGTFPDGSVIVFDLLEAVAKDHAVTEGPRKVLGVMHRDQKRWPETANSNQPIHRGHWSEGSKSSRPCPNGSDLGPRGLLGESKLNHKKRG